MEALRIILTVIFLLVAVALIGLVLMQSSQTSGLGSIAGGAETFFGKKKAKTYEAKLRFFTKIAVTVFVVLAVVLVLIQ